MEDPAQRHACYRVRVRGGDREVKSKRAGVAVLANPNCGRLPRPKSRTSVRVWAAARCMRMQQEITRTSSDTNAPRAVPRLVDTTVSKGNCRERGCGRFESRLPAGVADVDTGDPSDAPLVQTRLVIL